MGSTTDITTLSYGQRLSNLIIHKVHSAMPIGASNIKSVPDKTAGWSEEMLKITRARGDFNWEKTTTDQKVTWNKEKEKEIQILKSRLHQLPADNYLDISHKVETAIHAELNKAGNCSEQAALVLIMLCQYVKNQLENTTRSIGTDLIKDFTFRYIAPPDIDHDFILLSINGEHVICDPWLNLSCPLNNPTSFIEMLVKEGRNKEKIENLVLTLTNIAEQNQLSNPIVKHDINSVDSVFKIAEMYQEHYTKAVKKNTKTNRLFYNLEGLKNGDVVIDDIDDFSALFAHCENDNAKLAQLKLYMQKMPQNQLKSLLDSTFINGSTRELSKKVLKVIASHDYDQYMSLMLTFDAPNSSVDNDTMSKISDSINTKSYFTDIILNKKEGIIGNEVDVIGLIKLLKPTDVASFLYKTSNVIAGLLKKYEHNFYEKLFKILEYVSDKEEQFNFVQTILTSDIVQYVGFDFDIIKYIPEEKIVEFLNDKIPKEYYFKVTSTLILQSEQFKLLDNKVINTLFNSVKESPYFLEILTHTIMKRQGIDELLKKLLLDEGNELLELFVRCQIKVIESTKLPSEFGELFKSFVNSISQLPKESASKIKTMFNDKVLSKPDLSIQLGASIDPSNRDAYNQYLQETIKSLSNKEISEKIFDLINENKYECNSYVHLLYFYSQNIKEFFREESKNMLASLDKLPPSTCISLLNILGPDLVGFYNNSTRTDQNELAQNKKIQLALQYHQQKDKLTSPHQGLVDINTYCEEYNMSEYLKSNYLKEKLSTIITNGSSHQTDNEKLLPMYLLDSIEQIESKLYKLNPFAENDAAREARSTAAGSPGGTDKLPSKLSDKDLRSTWQLQEQQSAGSASTPNAENQENSNNNSNNNSNYKKQGSL